MFKVNPQQIYEFGKLNPKALNCQGVFDETLFFKDGILLRAAKYCS